ncbi:MAG: hypothetical protein LC797_25130 [Chloroflexi bacterium]|nr:hypothetical protein [Chloroflexota bacterium]
MTATDETNAQRDAFTAGLMRATAWMFELYATYIGDRLGLHWAVAAVDAVTSADLARRAGLNERYVREWLKQQTVIGTLQVVHHGSIAMRDVDGR